MSGVTDIDSKLFCNYYYLFLLFRFHCEASEPVLSHVVMPPLRDDVQLSVDEYRNKLYELMSVGTKAHIKHIRVNHGNRY